MLKDCNILTAIAICLMIVVPLQSVTQADVVNYFADTQSGATAINTEAYQTQALSLETTILLWDMLYNSTSSDVLKLVDEFFRDQMHRVIYNRYILTKTELSDLKTFTSHLPKEDFNLYLKSIPIRNMRLFLIQVILNNKTNALKDLDAFRDQLTNNDILMSYLCNVKRSTILNHLNQYQDLIEFNATQVMVEAATTTKNPEFFNALGDLLISKKEKDYDKIINCYLLGNDFQTAASCLGFIQHYSADQRIYICEQAEEYSMAYNICKVAKPDNYMELSRLARLAEETDEAINYFKLDKNVSSLFEAYFIAEQTGNPIKNVILANMPDSTAYRLVNAYSERKNYYKAYEVTSVRLANDKSLIISISSLAANEMLATDPPAFSQAAVLFELGGDYRQAASYYSKANDFSKAITNAEKINPKPYDMLIDLYTEVGNKDKANQYLDSLYIHDPEKSVAYYAKNGKTMDLRTKALGDQQYSIAIQTYGDYQSINEVEKDELMDLYQKAGDKAGLSKLVNQRISDMLESKKSLSLSDFDTLIQYYSVLGNTAKVTEFQNKANARKAAEEKKAAKDRQDAQAVYQLVGGRYVSSRHPSDEVVLYSDGRYSAVVFEFSLNQEISGRYTLNKATTGGIILNTTSSWGAGGMIFNYSGMLTFKIGGFSYLFYKQ